MAKFTWIQTRDGSPTLWNNELGESFRSVKGAFTESWSAFVQPALAWAARELPPDIPLTVGEFGLGPGTNWLLWNLAFRREYSHRPTRYFVIERDLASFELGLERWQAAAPELTSFAASHLFLSPEDVERILASTPRPEVFPTLEDAISANCRAEIWFHDPFGFDVNPEGYAQETLAQCARLWAPRGWGGSYASNRRFRESLAALPGVAPVSVPTGGEGLKRERMEFTWCR